MKISRGKSKNETITKGYKRQKEKLSDGEVPFFLA